MRVPSEQVTPEPPRYKVVFGWRAWVLFAILMTSASNNISSAIYRTRNQGAVPQLRKEIDALKKEIRQLEVNIEDLQSQLEQAPPATTEQ